MKILIAEDDKLVQRAYQRFFRDKHELTIASTGIEALELLNGGLRPDCIISDLEMPGMLGSTFCHVVRDLKLDTPFLLISGSPEVKELAESCGATAWAQKPGFDKVRSFLELVQLKDDAVGDASSS